MTDITRRDFLNGAALTIAAGLTPADQLAAQTLRYPPALTGMRGHHVGSFEIAHDLRAGKAFAPRRLPIEERYDLLIPGELFETSMIQALLTVIASSQFKETVEGMGGYSTRETGRLVPLD